MSTPTSTPTLMATTATLIMTPRAFGRQPREKPLEVAAFAPAEAEVVYHWQRISCRKHSQTVHVLFFFFFFLLFCVGFLFR